MLLSRPSEPARGRRGGVELRSAHGMVRSIRQPRGDDLSGSAEEEKQGEEAGLTAAHAALSKCKEHA